VLPPPMETITYSLLDGQKGSDQYYRDVAAFTDEVLAEAGNRISPLLEAFQASGQQTHQNTNGLQAGLLFEVLTLGTLWRVYDGQVPDIKGIQKHLLSWLTALRQKGAFLKAAADSLRGILTVLFLAPRHDHPGREESPTLADLDRLLSWLQATNDYDEAVQRMHPWRVFLGSQSPEKTAGYLEEIIALAAWFEQRSETVLGPYTPNVEKFLKEKHPSYRWREDFTFCGRQRVEYHLNMVGTELLNRLFRDAFLSTPRKIVIVPPCMRIQPEKKCKARATSLGTLCAACTPACRVNQLTRLGEKHGFQVLIMPDELSVFSGGPDQAGNGIGVVGVSCTLTNAPGGWKTEHLGIPAQGVLLDYCGCSYHWHKEGIPTDINFTRLLEVVGVQKAVSR